VLIDFGLDSHHLCLGTCSGQEKGIHTETAGTRGNARKRSAWSTRFLDAHLISLGVFFPVRCGAFPLFPRPGQLWCLPGLGRLGPAGGLPCGPTPLLL